MYHQHPINFLFPPSKYNMTRTSTPRPRPSKKNHRYRPQTVNLRDLLPKPAEIPPRVVYVQQPYYDQMECGEKTVHRFDQINYGFGISSPGHLSNFQIDSASRRSFLVTNTSRQTHRNFDTMLLIETIKDCLPDRDPHDL